MKPRKHQFEAMHIVDEIVSGSLTIRDFLYMVTPGGGKSFLPVIYAKLIQLGYADAIMWVCPRKTLQAQAESAFLDPNGRKTFGHSFRIRTSTNETNPCRGLNGFVTTYQALGLDDKKTVLQEVKSKRYILVMDEHHHAEEASLWETALMPIYQAAAYRVMMTGTIERHSGKRVAFTKYANENGYERPNLESDDCRVVTYTRGDALREKAIIPLHFTFADAAVEWKEASGKTKKYKSLKEVPFLDSGKAIYTAINTEYAQALIDKALKHWTEHRKENPKAKMLIVTPNISNAKEALDYLRTKWHYSDIATSNDDDAAQEAIRRFKNGGLDILVGVAMFYEGFDVKEISHAVSLTNIRSTPWIEQFLARSVRVSPHLEYSQQYGFIFTMDDPRMHDIVSKLKAEQLPHIKRDRPRKRQIGLFDSPNEDEAKPLYDIEVVSSSITNEHEYILGAHWPSQAIMDEPMGFSQASETPSEKERRLRKEIDQIVNRFCAMFKYKQYQANFEIKTRFGKSRADMTLGELERCRDHVQRTYVPHGTNRRRTIKREARRFYG